MTEALQSSDFIPKTPEQKTSLNYLLYPTRPVLLDARQAIEEGVISFRGNKIVYIPQDNDRRRLKEKEITVFPRAQYNSMVYSTLSGLDDAIPAESPLRQSFALIWDDFTANFEDLEYMRRFGSYVYYPVSKHMVHFAPPDLHRLALMASNATLIEDPRGEMGWEDIRKIFDNLVIGVVGTSVGSNIVRNIVMDICPKTIKFADPNFFKVTNGNRVWLLYDNMTYSEDLKVKYPSNFGLKNKAIGLAEEVHRRDPFLNVWPYYDGINVHNIDAFLGGVEGVEPRLDAAVDEMDDIFRKMDLREKCRQLGIRYYMATDAGSAVWIEIRPFDIDPKAPLAYGITDEELYFRLGMVDRNSSDRTNFFRLADGLVGDGHREGEFARLTSGKFRKLFKSIPQLGSTASVASGIVSEVIAATSLGWKFPERFCINKRTREVHEWGENV